MTTLFSLSCFLAFFALLHHNLMTTLVVFYVLNKGRRERGEIASIHASDTLVIQSETGTCLANRSKHGKNAAKTTVGIIQRD